MIMLLSLLWLTYLVTVQGDTTIVRSGSPPEAKWSEVAMDDSGKVQYGLSAEYSLFSSVDYGNTWTITNEELKGGVSVACDSSGQLLLVGTFKTMFISDDYGRTVDRVQSVPEGEYYSVAYSGDGKYLVGALVGGGIYMSNDFGESWAVRLASPPSGSFWRSVTISANGQRVYAVPSLGDLYRSMDAGVTWLNDTVSSKDWKDVDVDDSGTVVTASSVYGLVQSMDGGATWQDLPTLTIDIEVEDISESANGQCIVVSGSGKPLWLSTDQGQTWTAMDVPSAKWSAVVVSRNCDFILASVEDGGLFLSQNQGTDWVVHLATCEAGTGYSNGDCRSCNAVTSPEGMYHNDGSDLYCAACPSFTVSFDSITCTNPCSYPSVPDREYFTTPSPDQCLDLNFQVSVYVVAFIVLGISALYLLHLVLLFVHIPQLGKFHWLALLTVVCTAIPCLEVMVGLLYVFTMTIYNEFLAIAMFLALLLHPTLLVARDFWYQRTERHMHVRIWGERLVSTEVWEWLQYHRLVTDQWLAFVVANVVFGVITVLNLIWIVPMLAWLLLLYATKLYAFAAYARTWHGWWSGYFETSIPLVMTLTHGRNTAYVVDVHRFHEFSLWSVCLQSIPMLILVVYNTERMKETNQTTSSAPSASVIAALVIMTAIVSTLLVVYRMIVYRWIMNWSLKDMPTLLHGLNEAAMDDEDADYGTSPIRKSAGGRDSLRYSALQVDGATGGGGNTVVNELFKTTGTKTSNKEQHTTTVYQRRQFRQRQMALRRDHIRAKMKDADVAWERRMRQARMTIQRRFNQIQTIVQMQLYQSSEATGVYEGKAGPSASGAAAASASSASLMATADLLQPRPSFSSLQQPPHATNQAVASTAAAAAVNSSILPSVDLDETENVDLLVRDIERTLKSLDAELAQFLSEEIESKLTTLAAELRRKGSLIPGTPSDRGSFS